MRIFAICNEIINRSIKASKPITALKLQKIIYFIYGYGLAKYNKVLFNANFKAWRYGPVDETIYQEFKSYGGEDITSFAKDAKGYSYFPNWILSENVELYEVVNIVWDKYKNYAGDKLVDLTHQEGSAWKKTKSNEIIEISNIKEDVLKGLY